MTQSNDSGPSLVVAAVESDDADGKGPRLAAVLAAAFGVESRSVHADPPDEGGAPDRTPEESLAAAIADQLPAGSILVIESEHADRWRSRHSVAEHTIDAFAGPSVAIGPHADVGFADGPIIVALDGSPSAEISLAAAMRFATALNRPVELVRVVAEPLHPEQVDDQSPEAGAYLEQVAAQTAGVGSVQLDTAVVASNDPVTALVSRATARNACVLALASRGDRATARSSMSRTAAGLIAEARCPVLVVGG